MKILFKKVIRLKKLNLLMTESYESRQTDQVRKNGLYSNSYVSTCIDYNLANLLLPYISEQPIFTERADIHLYTCNVCFKRFQHPSSAARHQKIHTGEKPYSCSTCYRRFNRKESLRRHQLTHMNTEGLMPP